MSTRQHITPEEATEESKQPLAAIPHVMLNFRVPESVKWDMVRIAADRKTSMSRLAASLLEEFVALQKGSSA